MKQKEHHKAIIVVTLVSVLALMALIFPFSNQNSATGMLGGGQMLRTVPYSRMYEQSQDTPHTYVRTRDPCKVVQCGRPVAAAHAVLDIYNKPTTDEYGNIWCKCDGQAELYYRVSTLRKY